MSRFRFIEKGLCCDVFYDKKKDINRSVLFLCGFPATIGANNITDFLVENGYTVLHPQYYGTYDSEGKFTPQSAFKTVENIVEILRESEVMNLKNNKKYKLPNTVFMCIGYSFGAYVLRHTMQYLKDAENVLLFSPVMSNNPTNQLCWVCENGQEHLNYVLRTRPYTYRIDDKDTWMKWYVDDVYNECLCVNRVKNVLWFYGKKDETMIDEKINEKYLQATKSCISINADVSIYGIEKGEHGINTLLNEETKEMISAIL